MHISQLRDLVRYSSTSVSLDNNTPILSTSSIGIPGGAGGGGLSPQGSSTTGHNSGTNGREGAVGGESVRGGNGDNDNLHFSGRGAGGHDIPEWVLEPAAGQVPPSLRYTCRDEGASSVFKWSEMHGWQSKRDKGSECERSGEENVRQRV